MLRCKQCRVPLSGFQAKIARLFFGLKPSLEDPRICNKCIGQKAKSGQSPSDQQEDKPIGQKYKCQLCGRMIHEEHSLEHIKAEEYLLSLIQKDHPQWQDKNPTCKECIEYYRRLIKDSEI